MHCCISVFGYTADIASGKPVTVYTGYQNIIYSTVFQTVKYGKPVLCTFVLAYIQVASNRLYPIAIDIV